MGKMALLFSYDYSKFNSCLSLWTGSGSHLALAFFMKDVSLQIFLVHWFALWSCNLFWFIRSFLLTLWSNSRDFWAWPFIARWKLYFCKWSFLHKGYLASWTNFFPTSSISVSYEYIGPGPREAPVVAASNLPGTSSSYDLVLPRPGQYVIEVVGALSGPFGGSDIPLFSDTVSGNVCASHTPFAS